MRSNFILFGWLAGKLTRWPAAIGPPCAGTGDLVLTVTETFPVHQHRNLTYLLPDTHGALPYPDMQVRIYHDAHLVEARQWAAVHSQPLAAGAAH